LIVISTWDAFHGDLRTALEAFAAGDAELYKGCWSTNSDCTVFGAFGGVVQGATEVRSRLDWAASQYREGRYTAYDVLAEYAGEDMGCIVALERIESRDARGATITRERRITHVARREPEGWRIVHQHSDPLVAVTRPPT
jgi:ketosteroid isomerase-like protein